MKSFDLRMNFFLPRVTESMSRWFRPSPTTLVSPGLDVIMAGGLSIALFLGLQLFVARESDLFFWAVALYYTGFLINYPHFTASYQLLYGDARAGFVEYRTRPKFALKLWWAGVIVPALLIAYFFYALSMETAREMGYFANALYFFVGWHYVKQIYGCVIVLSVAKKVYFSRLERWCLLIPLYALWAVSFFAANTTAVSHIFYRIPYTTFAFPPILLSLSRYVLVVASIALLVMLCLKYFKEHTVPPLSAFAALISIYLWFIPYLSHPFYFYVIPFLHSLQYLLFVFAHRRNTAFRAAETEEVSGGGTARRLVTFNLAGAILFLGLPIGVIAFSLWQQYRVTLDEIFIRWGRAPAGSIEWLPIIAIVASLLFLRALWHWRQKNGSLWRFFRFFTSTYIIGILGFNLIPLGMDVLVHRGILPTALSYDPAIFGATLYFFFFTVFMNIHHYFIDNVIWKNDNPYIRNDMFLKETELAPDPVRG